MRARTPARFLLLAALAAGAFGFDVSSLKPQGYVSDFAQVIDAQSKTQLEVFSRRVERATGAQMAFVTVSAIDGEPIENVANELFRRWGVGQKGKDEGLLLLLVVREHRSRLEIGRGLEPIITDGTSGALLREMCPALREDRYGEAMLTAAHMLADRVARAKGVSLTDMTPPPRRQRSPTENLPWPMILGGAVLLFWLIGASRGGGGYHGGGGFLPGMILGSLLNRSSYGGHGSGGFGGYDSGDSFGGFGGGDSGGGGASSDW